MNPNQPKSPWQQISLIQATECPRSESKTETPDSMTAPDSPEDFGLGLLLTDDASSIVTTVSVTAQPSMPGQLLWSLLASVIKACVQRKSNRDQNYYQDIDNSNSMNQNRDVVTMRTRLKWWTNCCRGHRYSNSRRNCKVVPHNTTENPVTVNSSTDTGIKFELNSVNINNTVTVTRSSNSNNTSWASTRVSSPNSSLRARALLSGTRLPEDLVGGGSGGRLPEGEYRMISTRVLAPGALEFESTSTTTVTESWFSRFQRRVLNSVWVMTASEIVFENRFSTEVTDWSFACDFVIKISEKSVF